MSDFSGSIIRMRNGCEYVTTEETDEVAALVGRTAPGSLLGLSYSPGADQVLQKLYLRVDQIDSVHPHRAPKNI